MRRDLEQHMATLQKATDLCFVNAARDVRNTLVGSGNDPQCQALVRLFDEHLSDVWNELQCPMCEGFGYYYEECDVCGGTGHASCENCWGTGKRQFSETGDEPCPACKGTGDDTEKSCEWCSGDTEKCFECDECDGDGLDQDVLSRWKEAKEQIVASPLWKQYWLPLQESQS